MNSPFKMPDQSKPDDMLAGVVALRRMADGLEQRAVRLALKNGWTWSEISEALGVSRQAAHKRLAHLTPKR